MNLLLKLAPSVSYKVWGGSKLKKIKNIDTNKKIGETWEISSHSAGPSRVIINKTSLNELVQLSYLVKYIDTSDNLSVQVHPDDEYAKEHENENGKTECWLILDSAPGAGIYLGFKSGVTKKEFKTALEAGLSVDHFLNFYETRPGDFFVVPAGSVHAIGKGVTLCEVQQNSGVTYRVWDWNRMGDDGRPRELHIDKAMDVMNFESSFNSQLEKTKKQSLLDSVGTSSLYRHPDFKVELMNFKAGDKKEIRIRAKEGLSLVKGNCEIDEEIFKEFDSAISTGEGMVTLKALSDCSILSVLDKES